MRTAFSTSAQAPFQLADKAKGPLLKMPQYSVILITLRPYHDYAIRGRDEQLGRLSGGGAYVDKEQFV